MKPSSQQIDAAVNEALRLRERNLDSHHLARTVLHFQRRLHLLEDVLSHAKLYLHSGEGALEHAQLVRAIERAEADGGDDEGNDIKPW